MHKMVPEPTKDPSVWVPSLKSLNFSPMQQAQRGWVYAASGLTLCDPLTLLKSFYRRATLGEFSRGIQCHSGAKYPWRGARPLETFCSVLEWRGEVGGYTLNGWTTASSLGSWRQYYTSPLCFTLPSLCGLARAPDAEVNISEVLLLKGRTKRDLLS